MNVQLEKSKRNDLFKAITEGGLDAGNCVLKCDDAEKRITHEPSGSHYVLSGDAGRFDSTAVVGDRLPWSAESFFWDEVKTSVQRWASEVKDDVDTPDLWANRQGAQEYLSDACYENVANTPFTSGEQVEIAAQLRHISESIRTTYSLSQTQMMSLEAKLDDLKMATSRVGRKDWVLQFYGTLFAWLLAGLVPPEVIWHVLPMAHDALNYIFIGAGTSSPQLPPAP